MTNGVSKLIRFICLNAFRFLLRLHTSSKEAALLLGRLGKLLHGAVGQVLLATGDVLLAIASQLEN